MTAPYPRTPPPPPEPPPMFGAAVRGGDPCARCKLAGRTTAKTELPNLYQACKVCDSP